MTKPEEVRPRRRRTRQEVQRTAGVKPIADSVKLELAGLFKRPLKIPVRNYLGAVLPGLGDFPAGRIAELTPTACANRN